MKNAYFTLAEAARIIASAIPEIDDGGRKFREKGVCQSLYNDIYDGKLTGLYPESLQEIQSTGIARSLAVHRALIPLTALIEWAKFKHLDLPPDPAKAKENVTAEVANMKTPHLNGLKSLQIVSIFDGIYFNGDQWHKNLSDPPKWLLQARLQKGTRDKKHIALWDPTNIALTLLDKKVSISKIDYAFENNKKILGEWHTTWEEKSSYLRD
jgi:hypothetical protein